MLLAAIGILAGPAAPADAAKVPRAVLKSYFERGDKPTQALFGSLIDSVLNLSDHRSLLGLRTLSDGGAALLEEGAQIDGSLPFGPAAGLSDLWAGQSGYLGLSFLEDSEVHYGYLQVAAAEPGSSDLYPMFVSYFVFEDVAGAAIMTTPVPEPSTLALAVGAGLLGFAALARRARLRHIIRRKPSAA